MSYFSVVLVIIIFFSNIAQADIIKISPTDVATSSQNKTLLAQQEIKRLSSQVEALLAKEKPAAALELAKSSALKMPNLAKVQFFYVSLLVFLEQKPQALEHLVLLKKRFPRNDNAFFMSGVLHWQQGDSNQAISDMKKATELSPTTLKYWLMLSQMNHDGEGHGLNVHVGSLQALLAAEKYHGKNTDLLYRIAITYDEESKSKQALAYYEKVLAIDPSHNNANASSAINLLKINAQADVIKWQKAAASKAYRDYIRGIKLIYNQSFDEAYQVLSALKADMPRNGHLDYYLAKASLALANQSQALSFANAAIDKGIFPLEQGEMVSLIANVKPATFTFTMHKISSQGIGEAIGNIDIIELSKGIVIKPALAGLATGSHGFHVHQEGTCDNVVVDGKSVSGGMAMGHYMGHQHHGSPAGDLANIVFDQQKKAQQAIYAPQLTFAEVQGRSFMIHALASKNADLRIACGVVQ
ncbi:Cu/Zn superoxide dismutase [Colwellia chukchiensis]|uniref:Cu/Zn superoxide dismutase n=1 Tax=Colwellia chukchiensis TaxID=641665 RepID=A0A1H7NBY7_9GAMM|nr:superoxide dismutase family protein [Colwellia chukchiensis]SEL20465.1 Cu/Zn superoxide dismutase [Colwellia chukchiensis]